MTLHENLLWFTNIQQVEREISLRTECGLYYSYYKQLVNAPSLRKGEDEAPGAVVLLFAVLYLAIRPDQQRLEPILFYVYSVFSLNGSGLVALCVLAWLFSGSWLASIICACFYIVNLEDVTRVNFSVNIREHFALPVFWWQNVYLAMYLSSGGRRGSRHHDSVLWKCAILVTTLMFCLAWQFNQFVVLMQAAALYVMALLRLVELRKIMWLYTIDIVALAVVYVAQFGQKMLLGSLVLSFLPSAMLVLFLFRHWTNSGGIINGCLQWMIQVVFTLLFTIVVNVAVKWSLHLEADQHIYKFLKAKFGFADPRDFESRLYLCHGSFVFLDNQYFSRTSNSLVFPLYMIMLCGTFFVIGKDLLLQWCSLFMPVAGGDKAIEKMPFNERSYFFRRPEIAFFCFQSAVSALMAMMVLRMKYLWTPQICVLAAVLLGSSEIWYNLFSIVKFKKMYIVDGVKIGILLSVLLYNVVKESMNDLREFYDPDTVALMYWIGNVTAPYASFAGSMQLLAGVKCCTGRRLLNHPHFEDKVLRDRTKQIYQIYARRSAKEVYDILKALDTNYIILEDSICLARSDGCSVPDLIDLDNGHIPRNGYNLPGLTKVDTPRFCDQIRHMTIDFSRYFRLMFSNRTFRVYQLLA
ncbi:unnamed protein product [Soboliphyme baturini]|uniref:C-mannosyltransferase DPY19L1 n=1 Tax=Soboliphyme baturini TaxID=241478 RepID=A0A183IMR1_9BILA|nr:unnamed protein product [Soboliphyme baturini]